MTGLAETKDWVEQPVEFALGNLPGGAFEMTTRSDHLGVDLWASTDVYEESVRVGLSWEHVRGVRDFLTHALVAGGYEEPGS